jgi:plasmid maintenance system killer protein
MQMKVTLVLSTEVLGTLMKHERKVQRGILSFIKKFSAGQYVIGTNKENLGTFKNKTIHSVRINDQYRGIVLKENSQKYHLLMIEKHDDPYEWVKRNPTFKIDDSVELSTDDKYEKYGMPNLTKKGLFLDISKSDLQKLGVPFKYHEIIKGLPNIESFKNIKELLPQDAYVKLCLILNGKKIESLIEDSEEKREALIEYIENEVTIPALKNEKLSAEIKGRMENTLERIKKNMNTTQKIVDFVHDAFDSKTGREIHDALKALGLKTFEDIKEKIEEFNCIKYDEFNLYSQLK